MFSEKTGIYFLPAELGRSFTDNKRIEPLRKVPDPNKILNNGVSLPSAMAGYGKTNLAGQWLDQGTAPTVYLSMEPKNNAG